MIIFASGNMFSPLIFSLMSHILHVVHTLIDFSGQFTV